MAYAKVASGTSSTALLASKPSRSGFIVENSDANRLYILLSGGTAAADNYSFSLATNENAQIVGYSGPVVGIWAGDGSGHAHVTDLG